MHTRDEWIKHGYASRLARAVKDEVPPRGSLTIDSPGCTAHLSVRLQVHFVGDAEFLKCELADDAVCIGGRSVRLTFVWQKETTETEEETRCRFLLHRVARRQSASRVDARLGSARALP